MKNGNIKFLYTQKSVTIIGVPVLLNRTNLYVGEISKVLNHIKHKFSVDNVDIQSFIHKRSQNKDKYIYICISGIYVNKDKKNIGLILK